MILTGFLNHLSSEDLSSFFLSIFLSFCPLSLSESLSLSLSPSLSLSLSSGFGSDFKIITSPPPIHAYIITFSSTAVVNVVTIVLCVAYWHVV